MVDNSDSYAPVVQWSTIQFFIVLAIHMACVDWINTFPQAILAKALFMQTSRGFLNKFGMNGCLKLTQSSYGSKFAPKNWYMYLCKALLKLALQEQIFVLLTWFADGVMC